MKYFIIVMIAVITVIVNNVIAWEYVKYSQELTNEIVEKQTQQVIFVVEHKIIQQRIDEESSKPIFFVVGEYCQKLTVFTNKSIEDLKEGYSSNSE